MADLNPITAWRRMLALPNESRTKTVAVAFLTAVICAAMVSAATVMLRPIQAQNRAAEEQARLESLLATIPGMAGVLSGADGALSTVIVDLDRGRAAEGVTPETVHAALAEAANWTTLAPQDDIAGIRTRPDLAQIFLLRQDDRVTLAVLPVIGTGYNGAIEAMLAIGPDMRTLAGMTVTRHAETPGLGARIDERGWQAQFAGKTALDDRGTPVFAVARGPAASEFEVDGITGATRTGNGVTQMVRFWLGPRGYGPLLDAIRRGEF